MNAAIGPALQAVASINFDGSTLSAMQFASALSGLDAAQQKIVLTAAGMSAAQQKQIMEMMQLITASERYTITEFEKELGIESGTLAARLNTSATAMMTEELLRAAVANGALKKEQLQAIVSTNAQTGAMAAQSLAAKTLGASMKTATMAMLGNPLGWIAIAIGLLPTLIKGIGKLIETQKEAYDSADKLRSKYEEVKRELDGLEKELDTNSKRIGELQALSESGKITLVEQEELDRLSQTNAELATTIARKKEIAALDAKEANKKYVDAFEQERFNSYEYERISAEIDRLERSLQPSIMLAQLAEIDSLKEDLSRVDNGDTQDFETHIADALSTYAKYYRMRSDGVALTQYENKLLEDTKTELISMADTLEDGYLKKYEGEDAQTEYWQRLLDSINRVVFPAEYLTEKLASLPEEYKKELTDLGKTSSLTANKVAELARAYPKLDTWMKESGFTAEDVAKHYNSLAESVDEVGSAINQADTVRNIVNELKALEKMGGTVDLLHRKIIEINDDNLEIAKTWGFTDDDLGNTMTVASQTFRDGKAAIVVTPILPSGKLLTQEELEHYVDGLLENTMDGNYASNDTLGIVMGVFADGSSWEENLRKSDEFADRVHDLHEQLIEFAGSVGLSGNEASRFLDRLIELSATATTADNALDGVVNALDSYGDGTMELYDAMVILETAMHGSTDKLYDFETASLKVKSALIESKSGLLDFIDTNKQMEFSSAIAELEALASSYWDVAGAALSAMNAEAQAQMSRVLGFTTSTNSNAAGDIREQLATLKAQKEEWDAWIATLRGRKAYSGGSSGSSSTTKEVEKYVATLEDYREAIERLNKARQATAAIERRIGDSPDLKEQLILQRELIDAYEDEQAALHNLNNQRDATIHAGAQKLRELGFEVSYNNETNELWIANMERLNELTADSAGEYETLQEATNELRKNTEDLIESITDLNEANQDGSENWWELRSSIIKAREEIQALLRSIVKEASDAVDTIQNVYETLHDAANEYADTGYVSIDTLQSIIDLGVEYVSYLKDEDGQLVINEERIRDMIAAKTEQLAIESSLSYITALRIAQEENDTKTLEHLLYATDQASDATWGLVYANLALLELDEEQYQAALHNINAIRALADSAIGGIGHTAGEVTDQLNSMRSGLDDILKYVMDMLKDRINEQKKAFADIVALRKEAIDDAKKEADYQKNVAKRTQEIAKLQAKINALSLDDSREANAQRMKLEEELASLQESLADEQADYAREAQKESLDDMQKAFEEEKDAEISSYQKLYDLAIDYIQSHWDTLYNDLISWNSEYGSVLNSEITSAWDNCLAAAQRYGDYVSALNGIDADINSASGKTHNDTVYDSGYSREDSIHAIIKEMWANSQAWGAADNNTRDRLNKRNLELGARLSAYGINAFRGDDGVWYVDRVGGDKLYEKYKQYLYHSGGIAGDHPTLKQDEVMAVLKKGEPVLDEKREQGLYRIVDFVKMLSEKMGSIIRPGNAGDKLFGGDGSLRSVRDALISRSGRGDEYSFSPVVNVNISHNGTMTERDARRYGRLAADSALQELGDAFSKRGITNLGNATLK